VAQSTAPCAELLSTPNADVALAHAEFPSLRYRPLCPGDEDELQRLHAALFPINYEMVFFQKAVRGHDNIFSWAAMQTDTAGRERGMMGFITARVALLAEADPADRKLMRLDSPALDKEPVVYLLTIGTVPTLQRKGIASDLLRLVERRAGELSCRAVYLHVLAQFNAPAIAFYHRHGFWEASLLKGFYKISTGRQPDPQRTEYDALLLVHLLQDGQQFPAVAVLTAALAHLRSLAACMGPRRKNGLFLGHASCCVAVPPPATGGGSGRPPAAAGLLPGPLWLQRMFRGTRT
jgi:ribosomal protein S18 acetylase RimI-like enzyme